MLRQFELSDNEWMTSSHDYIEPWLLYKNINNSNPCDKIVLHKSITMEDYDGQRHKVLRELRGEDSEKCSFL